MFLLRVFTGVLFLDAIYYKIYLTRMRAPAVPVEDGGLGLGLFEAFEHFVEHDYKPLVQRAIDFPPELTQDERVAQGLSTTAFHLVNAVPLVCEAEGPGLKTFLDLPMITGCMGTHATAR